jgi:hypothetical protein
MPVNQKRRELIRIAVNFAIARMGVVAVGSAGLVTACGGGGGGGPDATQAPPPPQAANPSITSVSSTSPQALTALTIKTGNLDTTKSFTVTVTNTNGQGSINLVPIRTQTDGTIVVGVPLHLDSATGSTASLPVNLTVSQNGLTSSPTALTIADLPQLTDLGVTLGQVTRSFLMHQQITLSQNINTQQALAKFTGAKAADATLMSNLNASLSGAVLARNDTDRIVNDNTLKIPIGTASDGTPINFDANSVGLQDRIVAQYLIAFSKNSTMFPSGAANHHAKRMHEQAEPANAQTNALSGLQAALGTLTLVGGAAQFKSTQQALSSSDASTMDQVLSVATTLQTVVSVGATLVAIGATAAAAPEIALGAAAVVTYAAIAGVVLGAASIGNDLYNVATSGYAAVQSYGTPDYQKNLNATLAATTSLVTDFASTALQAAGVGGLTTSSVTGAAVSVAEGLFVDLAESSGVAAKQFALTAANIAGQAAFSNDGKAADDSLQQLPATPPSSTDGFGTVTGSTSISNSGGPLFAGLTGVSLSDSSGNQFTTIADTSGQYSCAIPTGNPNIDYSNMTLSAYDPADGSVLATQSLNLSNLAPGGNVQNSSSIAGSCNDTDANSGDADDPDCD